MYTGVVSLEKQSGRDMLSLMVAADELLLEELVIYVQDYLVTDQCSWVQQNFVQVLHTVFRLSNCKKLQDFCLESICEDPQPFFISSDFNELDKEILFDQRMLIYQQELLTPELIPSMNNTQSFQSGFLTQMEWKYSLDSFLFNSDDIKNIKTMHLSRVSTPNQAHYASTHHAVNFGNSDLICNGLAGSCYKNYYQYRLLESEFTTEEIEIFAVNPQ
ncbi:24982_t:CDS:2 [Gigaspora margarita]|uniref:24982_t:CDS:1 n=1 Tax=Gigaspora margarita TaxID=4874 RepID=A0ABN7VFE5_GIGMA|nr:24982_t:CDS:2 [Gigaspora margarita]